jgi:hypothetical protein
MKKFCLFLALFLIIVILGIYIWKILEVKGLEKRMEEQKIILTKRAQGLMESKTKDFLRLSVIPLCWAVQKEMVSGNLGLIDSYFIELVKEKNMKLILLSNMEGKILVSTDKSLEGKEVFSIIPMELMDLGSIKIEEDINENIRVVAPIFNLNQKIGILVIVYKKEKVSLEEKE